MRRIAVVTGTRAEYGLLKPTMLAIKQHPKLELKIIAAAMHFLKDFGNTFKEIEEDGFKIDAKVDIGPFEDSELSMATAAGAGIIEFAKVLQELKPDVLLTLGDRIEQFAATVAGAYMNVYVAHIASGDKTEGGLDESARHAATKFAHIHFSLTEKTAERTRKMGEKPKNIHVIGGLNLDTVLHEKTMSKEELRKEFSFDFNKTVLLVVQHSISTEPEKAEEYMTATMEAIKELKHQTIVIYPNADVGGRRMIKMIERYTHLPFIKAYKNLKHNKYLSLLKHCSALVGNSSSGIIEAPSFKKPVVNIGRRQSGRERSTNIIDVEHKKEKIIMGIRKALSDGFRKEVEKCVSPYGDGTSGKKIAELLSTINLDKSLLKKQITY